ncbi:DndE family protein [Saccharicrinis sp. 156]|uniref:DndE family protein n=1 Tax=Saccharicrinis sp. 156 TaxID=3417574 RepID=UPI003D35689A
MFANIKTSKENREVVANLTRKLNLGTENIIARIAFTYSLSKEKQLKIADLKDSGGKEYSRGVLFGDNYSFYIALLSTHYNLYKTDKDLPKYVKLHIDDGLELIQKELDSNPNLNGFEYVIDKIEGGLNDLVTN